jgi:hypothetical protein
VRLWRAQLRNAAAIEGSGGKRLISTVQNMGWQSTWDQAVVCYLLADLKAGGNDERIHAAAKLIEKNVGTKSQRLGSALELTRVGLLVCAVEAFKQLVAAQEVDPEECLELCALLVANLPAAAKQALPEADGEGWIWLQNVALHLQASSLLISAASTASGEHDRRELLHRLEALATTAAKNRPGLECGEYAAIALVREGEEARARIHTLLQENEWLQAVAEFELLPKQPRPDPSLHGQIRAAVLADFAGVARDRAPADYAAVNQLREEQRLTLIENWKAGMEATARLENATPIVLINSFAAARRGLEDQPFWIAYGNVRTGSTMVFNLLRILANSLSASAISAWEGDFVSPEKFFQLINESVGITIGVLKIHRSHQAINERLNAGQAKAILSCRDMAAACFSYWRMLHNPRSPFFNDEANLACLDRFLKSEIENFRAKSMQPNTLIVREADLRFSTLDTIRCIAGFMGVELADESLNYLSVFLSPKGMQLLAQGNQKAINSTGHEQVTYLHPGHISESGSEQQCPVDVREYIETLIHKNYAALDKDGYCRVVAADS